MLNFVNKEAYSRTFSDFGKMQQYISFLELLIGATSVLLIQIPKLRASKAGGMFQMVSRVLFLLLFTNHLSQFCCDLEESLGIIMGNNSNQNTWTKLYIITGFAYSGYLLFQAFIDYHYFPLGRSLL